jgi:hypothetical protein
MTFPWRGRNALGDRQAFRVLLKTLAAEELSPNWFFERCEVDSL